MPALSFVDLPNYETLELQWNRQAFRNPLYSSCQTVQTLETDPITMITVEWDKTTGNIVSSYGALSLNVGLCTFLDCTCDQLSRLWLCYIVGGDLYLYWYDPVTSQFENKYIAPANSCALFLDDQRYWANVAGNSRVIMVYSNDTELRMRDQLDRFEEDSYLYAMREGEVISSAGMNIKYRVQITLTGVTLESLPADLTTQYYSVEIDTLPIAIDNVLVVEEFNV